MVRVLVASDKFKGSLTAAQAARSVARGIRQVRPDAEVSAVPVADGGDGTLAAAFAAGFTQVPVKGSGPTGERVDTCYARRGDLAVVELADVSGLARLPGGHLAPVTATSRQTGEVVAAAVEAGCRWVVLGVGGSASTDGGAGLFVGLGARLLDDTGREIGDGGMALREVARVDLGALHDRLAGVEVTVACDVTIRCSGRGAPPRSTARRRAPPRSRWSSSTRPWATGPTPSPRPAATTGATPRGRGPPVESASPRSRSSAPPSAPASTWCSTWSASTTGWTEPTSS